MPCLALLHLLKQLLRQYMCTQVPDGYRMVVQPGPGRSLRRLLHPLLRKQPTWEWQYSMADSGLVQLALREQSILPTTLPFGLSPQSEPLSWVI